MKKATVKTIKRIAQGAPAGNQNAKIADGGKRVNVYLFEAEIQHLRERYGGISEGLHVLISRDTQN